MKLPIIQYGNSLLRKKCKKIPVEEISSIENLVEEMFETLTDACGLGLAAPQIGKDISLFIVQIPERCTEERVEWNGQKLPISKMIPLVIINPKLKFFGKKVSQDEGCLSIKEIHETISRPSGILATFLDMEGKTHFLKCEGLLSRIFQHEFDHLQGKLFIDRLSWFKRRKILKILENSFE